jgi:hypothetical protein
VVVFIYFSSFDGLFIVIEEEEEEEEENFKSGYN